MFEAHFVVFYCGIPCGVHLLQDEYIHPAKSRRQSLKSLCIFVSGSYLEGKKHKSSPRFSTLKFLTTIIILLRSMILYVFNCRRILQPLSASLLFFSAVCLFRVKRKGVKSCDLYRSFFFLWPSCCTLPSKAHHISSFTGAYASGFLCGVFASVCF